MSIDQGQVVLSLDNGDKVKVNDHVYCSPNWAARDGTPYSVARIMEFLPPEGTPRDKGKARENFTRVRLAWYYRPSDVTDRPVADCRLLLAAIYSEVTDINQVRAKCYVVHRDKISDLAGWRKRPDRFYFNKLFDPYIKKEFDIIQATDVRNLPTHIRQTLIDRYEYVVAEKEIVYDLTDLLRLCHTCGEWCPHPETVQCDRCKKFFHMSCVNPPLLAKPTRGYGWTCAPCSRAHEEEVEGHEIVRHATPQAPKPKSNAPPARGRGRPRKDRTLAEKEENMEVKHFKMWPFRYFGLYTVAEDTLDPDDFIFPRAATRVGPKYQAVPPPVDYGVPPLADQEERGGDETIEVLSIVNEMTDDEVAELERCKRTLTQRRDLRQSVDWLTEVTHRFTDAYLHNRPFSSVSMKSPLRLDRWKKQEARYTDREWNDEEKVAFDDGIALHGAELRAVREEVGTRTIAEVVRYYGHWKNERLGEDNARIKQGLPPVQKVIRETTSEEEGSIITAPSKGNRACAACHTRDSKIWWKAPKGGGLSTNVLCDTCGPNWRKYADLNVRTSRDTSAPPKGKSVEKREGTPLSGSTNKRARTSASLQSTPPPAPVPTAPQLRCLACQKPGPMGKVLKCKQCQFRIHSGVCGAVVDPATVDQWTCELCQNETNPEASLITDCLLCPKKRRIRKKKEVYPPADSFLRACKPTEGQGWSHVLCAVFMPGTSFTDASQLRLVEGIGAVEPKHWTAKCVFCGESGGAVLKCSDCPKEFHVSCAWQNNYRFGFEIQPVKASRKDVAVTVDFKDASGVMSPVICCREHHTKRHLFEICETNEVGDTALQVYCRRYKQAPVHQSHGLLRKAYRLDSALNVRPGSASLSTRVANGHTPDPECSVCHTEFSPYFWDKFGSVLCHKCTFLQKGDDKQAVTFKDF